MSSSCIKEVRDLKNELIFAHSVLLQFVRVNNISEGLMQEIGSTMKRWDKKVAADLRREHVADEHDRLMSIIKNPLQSKMKK